MDDEERLELWRFQLKRAEELERRALDGTDDIAYCVKWAGIHRNMVAAAVRAYGNEP